MIRTNDRAQEDSHIAGKREQAECSSLCFERRVLREHSSDGAKHTAISNPDPMTKSFANLHNGAGEDSSHTAEKDHLPYTLAETEQASHDRHTNDRIHKNRFATISIRSTTPGDHKDHLREGKERFLRKSMSASLNLYLGSSLLQLSICQLHHPATVEKKNQTLTINPL